MKKIVDKIWKVCCVPVLFLCGGLVLGLISRVCTQYGLGFGLLVRFALALVLFLFGMFLLRRMSKRLLLVSSAIVCAFSLAYYAVLVYRFWFAGAEVGDMAALQNILSVLIIVPNNIMLPIGTLLSADSFLMSAVVLTVIEILLPMLYAFSGVFNRIISASDKKTP